MTTPYSAAQPQSPPIPTQVSDYVAVFGEQQPPVECNIPEHKFTAISDTQAEEVMQREFRACRWTLYRIDQGERKQVAYHFEER